jgi:hypothetical protein
MDNDLGLLTDIIAIKNPIADCKKHKKSRTKHSIKQLDHDLSQREHVRRTIKSQTASKRTMFSTSSPRMLLILLLSATTAWAQFNFNFGNMFQQQAAPEKQNMPSDSEWYQTNYENGARDNFLLYLCLAISIALLLFPPGRR